MKTDYYAMIDEIFNERLKTPGCLIDAEALASLDSQKEFDKMQAMAAQQKYMSSAVAKRDGGSQKSAKGSKQKSSQSQSKANESVSKSQTSDMMSSTQMSQTGTN